jgi:MoaA/NifB/PqqE/SkfB family radical SAM enzyme
MHLTLATNGTTMTPELAAQLAAAGLRYVEISLDSVDSARHDAFRGREGLWERSVRGAKTVVATEGLRLGIAMCVHQGNFHEVRDMIRFAEDLGAGCFAHFNFIPVGRGLRMVAGDITPAQREQLLGILNAQMQTGGMGVISTAPQLGRICLAGAAGEDGRVSCSHAGSGSGVKARVVAKYLGGCGAGRTYVCIEPNGNVTPCVYMPHRVMGNVREKPLMAIFRDSVFWEILNDRPTPTSANCTRVIRGASLTTGTGSGSSPTASPSWKMTPPTPPTWNSPPPATGWHESNNGGFSHSSEA